MENLVHMPLCMRMLVYLCVDTIQHFTESQLQLLSPIIIMPRSGEWASTAKGRPMRMKEQMNWICAFSFTTTEIDSPCVLKRRSVDQPSTNTNTNIVIENVLGFHVVSGE